MTINNVNAVTKRRAINSNGVIGTFYDIYRDCVLKRSHPIERPSVTQIFDKITCESIDVETLDGGKTWLLNGTDISKSGVYYNVATSAYVRDATELKNVGVTTLYETNITQTRALLEYLKIQYPPC
ncbi:unnamed protein product [Rotaria magnacalcarata]|uniref:Uncharacterized protein n=1 Tax=Rotaria magnacalcarata TaxID=392030 RepID=A0A816R4D7_9BILA|nr:unnamed protein product [Rotaria magnacalcarata]